MRYSTEPRHVKGYGNLSFVKKIRKNLRVKYNQTLFDSATKYATNAIKTTSNKAVQETAEETGDLIAI